MSISAPSLLGRLLGYDGVIATLLLGAFQFFLVSLWFIACMTPVLAFQALVGWQSTHLALWLGAASLSTAAPALQALVTAAASPPPIRRPTKPTRSSKRRRVDAKVKRGKIKEGRRKISQE
jgi:hypothetical protein